MSICLRFKKKDNSVSLPEYKTVGSAGADIKAHLSSPITILPLERKSIPTGLFPEIPVGYEIQIRPRSGLAFNSGITVLNTPGTIDSDYRGEIKICLINLSNDSFTVNNGDRIAQMVVAPVIQSTFSEVDEITSTERGEGGFGSTGV